MTLVNIHDAKTNLSKLVDKAMSGHDIVIAKAGKPKVRLVPVRPQEDDVDWFGMDQGKIWMADDFDELPDDVMAAFNGDNEHENID